MAIAVPDLTALDSDEVQQTLDFIAQRVAEYAPTVERQRGVVRQIVLDLNSILGAAQSQVINDQVVISGSLLQINENPEVADPEMVDRLLSNFRVIRRSGAAATGQVAIVISRSVPVTISKGMRFESGGMIYTTDNAFAARTTAATVVNNTDRLIRPAGTDFAFTIDVTAEVVGAAGQLSRGTALTPQSLIPDFVRAYAEDDFIGGLNEDTNEELLDRLQQGLADRSSSNRTTIASMIVNEPAFERVLAVSVIGYGDPEQIRYHTIFPVAQGGRVDVYARTQAQPQSLVVTRSATLIEKTAAGGVWQFSIARDDVPGFYEVEKIVLAGHDLSAEAGYEVTETVRGIDLSDDGTGLTPDVVSGAEAAFSRFQAATVRFLDTDTEITALTVNSAKADYDVAVTVMPLVQQLQEFLSDRDRRHSATDILVRAPIPVFLSLNFTVRKSVRDAAPDLDAIRTALASYVNNTGFIGRLSASSLAHVVHQNLAVGQTASAIEMFGRVLRPDGTTAFSRSYDTLEIPNEPEKMVSSRTAVFYLDPRRIGISVESV